MTDTDLSKMSFGECAHVVFNGETLRLILSTRLIFSSDATYAAVDRDSLLRHEERLHGGGRLRGLLNLIIALRSPTRNPYIIIIVFLPWATMRRLVTRSARASG